MSWQTNFLEKLGPGLFPGISTGQWILLLHKIRFNISPAYIPRAAFVSGVSMLNSVGKGIEHLIYSRRIAKQKVQLPVFILGSWRSGTTHLQNLLSHDDRFGFPSLYQTLFPSHFLYTEKILSGPIGWLVPGTRPQDNVKLSMDLPSEEEIGICNFSARSHLVGDTIVPNHREKFADYLTLDRLSHAERESWLAELKHFVQKLALRHQKRLMLKSPGHTARIKYLLELFPDAKFINIHRHPFEVMRSGLGWLRKTRRFWRLQENDDRDIQKVFLDLYSKLINAYFSQKKLIAKNRIVEVGHRQLEQAPIEHLKRIYKSLDLPEFDAVEQKIEAYLNSNKNYKKNKFDPLPRDLENELVSRCSDAFEHWGYSKEDNSLTKAA